MAKKYPKVAVPPRRRRCGPTTRSEERRQLLRLSRPGATMWTASPPACRPRPTSSASSPPSRSRIRAAQHQLASLLGARKVNPKADGAGDLHRRLVDAGARSRGDQRADRCRLRRHHLPRRQPEGRDPDRREAAASRPAATTPARRRWRQRLHHRRRVQVETIYKQFADDLAQGQDAAELRPSAATTRTGAATPPTAPAPRPRHARPPTPPSPS